MCARYFDQVIQINQLYAYLQLFGRKYLEMFLQENKNIIEFRMLRLCLLAGVKSSMSKVTSSLKVVISLQASY